MAKCCYLCAIWALILTTCAAKIYEKEVDPCVVATQALDGTAKIYECFPHTALPSVSIKSGLTTWKVPASEAITLTPGSNQTLAVLTATSYGTAKSPTVHSTSIINTICNAITGCALNTSIALPPEPTTPVPNLYPGIEVWAEVDLSDGADEGTTFHIFPSAPDLNPCMAKSFYTSPANSGLSSSDVDPSIESIVIGPFNVTHDISGEMCLWTGINKDAEDWTHGSMECGVFGAEWICGSHIQRTQCGNLNVARIRVAQCSPPVG